MLQSTVGYAKARAAELGKAIDFSLTTNATLLKPEVIEFLAEHNFGVTISIDGPPDLQNKFRVFQNGAGSYELVVPKIKALLARHRSRPIGARVTLTRETLDVRRIYDHLTHEIGFWEVGFAPVTAAPGRAHAFGDEGFEYVLAQFRDLANDYRDAALAGRHHGFSNVRETLQEIHKGASKAWPCGAGFGLLGVSTAGDVNLCHRFAGSDEHKLGTVRDGIDREVQRGFLESHHVATKTDCQTCWARPLCAGGCYHEAHTRYGTTDAAQPALLRLDSRLDRHLSPDLRRDRAAATRRFSISSRTAMKHLSPVNAKATASRAGARGAPPVAPKLAARNARERRRDDRCRRPSAAAAAAAGPAHSARLLDAVLAGLGGGPHRRHRRALPAGRARSVRLPPRLLLAGAGARPAEPRARLDEEVRGGPERLAQDRHHLPVSERDASRRSSHDCGVDAGRSALGCWRSRHRLPRPARHAGRQAAPSAGTGTIYVSTYKGVIDEIDEATEKLIARDSGQERHPGPRDASRTTGPGLYVRDVDLREGRDHRSREAHHARHVHADRGHDQDAHLEPAARSARQVPDPRRSRTTPSQATAGRSGRRRSCSTTWRRRRSRGRFPGRKARSARASASSSRRTAS